MLKPFFGWPTYEFLNLEKPTNPLTQTQVIFVGGFLGKNPQKPNPPKTHLRALVST